MKAVEIIKKTALPVRGVYPGFTPYHVLEALTIVNDMKHVGRLPLMKMLGLGEGSVKTMIRRLKERHLVDVSKGKGITLTSTGKRIVEDIYSILIRIGEVSNEGICDNCLLFAVIIRGGEKMVEKLGGSVAVRDSIVRNGGQGGLILYYLNGKIYMPTPTGLEKCNKIPIVSQLMNMDILNEGDAIIASICNENDKNCEAYLINAVLDALEVVDC